LSGEPPWDRPPATPVELPAGVLHVWRASLDLPAPLGDRLASWLSPAERQRAARFRTRDLADRFVAGRGIVRDVLARYLGEEPARLRFGAGERGKPALDAPHGWLRFNASNSGGLTLVAVAREMDVGVDLEELRPVPEATAIAERMLSRLEQETLRGLPEAQRELAFLHCWTRKEAFIKALGAGLWTGLDRFDVAFAPGQEPALLAVDGSAAEAARWTLRALEPGPGYVGAVVAHGLAGSLATFDWEP